MAKVFYQDLDGVSCDFNSAMTKAQNKLSAPGEPPFSMDLWKQYEKRSQHMKDRGNAIIEKIGFWKELKPIPLGLQILQIAKEAGFRTVIATKGPQNKSNAWKEKVEWVRENIDSKIEICIVSDKGLLKGDVLHDDWPEYCESFLTANTQAKIIMPMYSYNASYNDNRCVHYPVYSHIIDNYSNTCIKKLLKEWFDE